MFTLITAEKTKFVDKTFSGQAEKHNESWSMQSEQQIIEFQRKCEERKKVELAAEVSNNLTWDTNFSLKYLNFKKLILSSNPNQQDNQKINVSQFF